MRCCGLKLFLGAFALVAVTVGFSFRRIAAPAIVFSVGQRLELEPCGCSLGSLGGLDRQLTQLKSWRADGEAILFSAGPSFVDNSGFTSPSKSEYLVKKWNEMGLRALALARDDLKIGKRELGRIARMAKFPLLATNLSPTKDVTTVPYLRFNFHSKQVLVLGLGTAGSDDGMEMTDPAEAAERVVTESKAVDMVLILSSLSSGDRARVRARLKVAHLILGGGENEDDFFAEQYSPKSLFLTPLSRGRALARFQLNGSGPVTEFFNPVVAVDSTNRREWVLSELLKIESDLRNSKGTSAKRLRERQRELAPELAAATLLPLEKPVSSLCFKWDVKLLDSRIDPLVP